MKRRDFLRRTGQLCLATALGQRAAIAAPSLKTHNTLVLGCQFPEAPAGTYDYAWRLARHLERILPGGTKIRLETLTAAPIDALNAGIAHATLASENANIPHAAELAFIAGLPGRFALSPAAAQSWLSTAGGEAYWHTAHRNTAARPIYAGCQGAAPALWARRPLPTLSNLKIAMEPGLCAEVIRAFGGEPVELPAADRAAALASGEIDAADMPCFEDAVALGLPKVAGVCHLGAIAEHSGPLALTFAPGIWLKLAESCRSLVRREMLSMASQRNTAATANASALRSAMAQAFGVTFISGLAGAPALNRVSEAVIAEASNKDGNRSWSGAHRWHHSALNGKQLRV